MKILVTGATGNVGSEVVRQLSEWGIPVIAAVRNVENAKRAHAAGPSVEFRPFDYADPKTWLPALAGAGKIYLVIPPGTTNPLQVEHFFKTAIQAGVRHLVFNSGRTTCDLPGEPLNVLEGLVRNSDTGWTILRPGWFMQNFLNWVGFTIPGEDAFYLPAADSRTAFVDVRDIGAVAAEILTGNGHETQVYQLTSNEALNHYEVAQKISEAVGRTIRYVHLSDEEYVKEMVDRGWKESAARHTVFLYRIVRAGKEAEISADIESLLGKPAIDFDRFASDHATYWSKK